MMMFARKNMPNEVYNQQQILAQGLIERLRVKLCEKTNPQLINEILDALQITRFKPRDSDFSQFIQKITTEPLNTKAMINKLSTIMLNNEPLYTLLARIEELHLISDEEFNDAIPTLNLQIHLLCIFEAFSITMSNSKTFNEDIYNFINGLRHSSNPGNPLSNFFFASGSDFSIFKNMKIVAVDPVITSGAFSRSLDNLDSPQDIAKQAEAFIKKYNLSLWNSKIDPYAKGSLDSIKNIGLNMIWAICGRGEHNPLQKRNAQAGCGLIAVMEALKYTNTKSVKNLILPPEESLNKEGYYSLLEGLKVDSHPKVIDEFYMTKKWMDLYTLWDLLFLIDEFDAVFLPIKLLIPSILGAAPEHYIESRVYSLYLMGNLYHACKTDNNPLFKSSFHCLQRDRIFEEWSMINDRLVNKLIVTDCPNLNKTTEDIYNQTIGKNPSLSLLNHLLAFVSDYEHFSLTKEETSSCCALF